MHMCVNDEIPSFRRIWGARCASQMGMKFLLMVRAGGHQSPGSMCAASHKLQPPSMHMIRADDSAVGCGRPLVCFLERLAASEVYS